MIKYKILSNLRELIALIIRLSGLTKLIYCLCARNKVSIILYHNPDVEIFERHMDYISKKYNFITLDTLVCAIESKDWSEIPRYPLVVTFDDGHKNNYKLLPVFEGFKVKPTIYLCTGIVNTSRHYWFTKAGSITQKLKSLPHQDRLEYLKTNEEFSLKREYPSDTRQALSLTEMEEMKVSVNFEAHTQFHPILTTMDSGSSNNEIKSSRFGLDNFNLGVADHFAYPNGDYTQREVSLCRDAGFRSARTIDCGWNSKSTDLFRLKITGVSDNASVNILISQLSGIPSFIRYLLKGSLIGRHKTILPN